MPPRSPGSSLSAVPQSRKHLVKTFGDAALSHDAPSHWNSLLDLQGAENTDTYKPKLKNYCIYLFGVLILWFQCLYSF